MNTTKLPILIALILCTAFTFTATAQCGNALVNHWETCVYDNNNWKYVVPAAPIANWTSPAFNDAAWSSGNGGLGYGDNDDATVLPNPSTSVYMRRTFTIFDTSLIVNAIFCMDYDDGFVAYLNGVEIARSNIPVAYTYNTLASADHEAQLYQGFQPEYFTLSALAIDTLLKNGSNVLCIETHNYTVNSTDLTSRPFLILGMVNANVYYGPTPAWFSPPFPLYSNIPIISINTLGQSIVDDPRIFCDMGIIDNGPGNMNCITDPYNNYNGKISIEIRGSSSQMFPKKGYGLSTLDAALNPQNVSVLGMPAENDWVLLASYNDKAKIRDVLVFDIVRAMGWYSSRARFVELVINGDYKGLYIFLEKIKQDKNRVDVSSLNINMNAGDSLTGGYVYKMDWGTGNAGASWNTSQGVTLQNHDPNWDVITPTQKNYLINYINNFESRLFGANFTDPNLGYRKVANPYSFADDFIIQEFTNNLDGYRASNYMHKDRDSKCGRHTLGPYWDYGITLGNANFCFGESTTGWQINNGCTGVGVSTWIQKMFQDQWFKNLTNCRWNELRQGVLSNNALFTKIDTYANYIRYAANRDSARWGIIGVYVWPNQWTPATFQAEVDSMKSWIGQRLTWLDANIYPTLQPCNSVAGLNLVIDEINFHSDSTTDAGDWLELYNYGATAINLSNASIIDGDSYERYCVLPDNTTLAAGARLVIYSDSVAFANQFPGVVNKLGPLCFKLNNFGQKIVIKDKDNKLIYSVNYLDNWQCSADGNGRTLQLLNTGANPNVSSSWFAGCMGGSPGVAYAPCSENLIYSEINYNSSAGADAGDWIELHNKNTLAYPLAGWSIRDGSDNNVFTFPANSIIAPLGYLVAYSDAAKFNAQFPAVANKVGPLGFGFASAGDAVRVFDNTGKLRFSVCYGSSAPWPTTPNAGGFTLENSAYSGNQNASTTWFAGCLKGSPGVAYTPCWAVSTNDLSKEDYITLYPNPASQVLNIESSLKLDEILIFDNIGRLMLKTTHTGQKIDISGLQNGVYHLQCNSGGQTYNVKFVKAD
jgi:hypothetical protein